MSSTRRGGGYRRSSSYASSPATNSSRIGSSFRVPETQPTPETVEFDTHSGDEMELEGSEVEAGSVVSNPKYEIVRDPSTGNLVVHPQVSRVCTRSFKRVPNPTGFNWHDTPVDVKEKYFTFWKKWFTWPEGADREVYLLWEGKCRTRFSNYIHDMKKKRDPTKPDQGRPQNFPEDWWRGLCTYWDTPETVEVSQRARGNRMTEVDGPGSGISKHCGGSRSVSTLAREMAAQNHLSMEQCVYASFKAIHTRKDGTWTTPNDASIDARVQELAEEQGEGADLNMIYQTVVAEKEAAKEFKKKNRMYGTGSLARSLLSTGSSSSTTSQFQASPEIQNQLTTLQQQLLEVLIQEQQARFQEQQQARIQEQAKQLAAIQQMLSQSKFPPPPPPVDD